MDDIGNELKHRSLEVMTSIDMQIVGEDVGFLLNRCINKFDDKEEILKLTNIVLDLCWEKLNTGYWKEVPGSWRLVYSLMSIYRALALADTKQALNCCDKGCLLGAPIMNNILARLSSILHKKYSSSLTIEDSCISTPDEDGIKKVELKYNLTREKSLNLMDFMLNYFACEQPVLITNAADHWPAMKKWNINYIKQIAGYRTVPVEVGSKYTDDGWSQRLMTVNEFIEKFLKFNSNPVGYLAQHQLFDQILELKDDICVPEYCLADSEEDDVDINAWFGPVNTVSPLHYDPRSNILTQVVGAKYIRLYSPTESAKLYPLEDRMFQNTSQVDIENPDETKFPLFPLAKYVECYLNPGEMLYIPKKWWHFVKSLSNSFSVSFWFGQSD